MIWDMEHHVRDVILEHVGPAGFDSVGVHVTFDHAAATPIGSTVKIETSIRQVHAKPKVTLVEAETAISDAVGELGRGVHTRAVVEMGGIASRIAARQAQLAEAGAEEEAGETYAAPPGPAGGSARRA